MGKVPVLSYSGFRTYSECPQRWKFLYLDRLPEAPRSYFSFGRSIHSALEEFVAPLVATPSGGDGRRLGRQTTLLDFPGEAPRLLSVEELLALYERHWVREGYSSPEEEKRYFDLGRDLLIRFHRVFSAELPMPLAVEKELAATVEGLPVHGIIDRIDRRPEGGLEVLDYKTTRELSLRDAAESDQLTLYQMLVEGNYDLPVERLTLYHLRSLTPLRSPARDRDRVADLAMRLGEVADGIRSDDQDPTPGPYCKWCEFRRLCPEFREVPSPDRERVAELVRRYRELRTRPSPLPSELEEVTQEIQAEAKRLDIRRLPGANGSQIHLRREARWTVPLPEALARFPVHGVRPPSPPSDDPDRVALRRHDPRLPPALRRELLALTSREVSWHLDLEGSGAF